MAEVLENVDSITKRFQPESFVTSSTKEAGQILDVVKTLFDYAKSSESKKIAKQSGPLQTLFVTNFDAEQIWEELQLQNEPITKYLQKRVDYLVEKGSEVDFGLEPPAKRQKLSELDEEDDGQLPEEAAAEEDDGFLGEDLEDEDDLLEESDKADGEAEAPLPGESAEEAAEQEEDPFYSPDEMEKFILEAEAQEDGGEGILPDDDEDDEEMAYDYVYGEKAGEDDALFAGQKNLKSKLRNEDLEDDYYDAGNGRKARGLVAGNNAKYSDFFDEPDDEEAGELDEEGLMDMDDEEDDSDDADRPRSKFERENMAKRKEIAALEKQSLFELSTDHEDLDPKTQMSRFEAQAQRQQRKIAAFEQENIGEKPWQLKGEVKGTSRPKNSLLEETVEFETASKPAPIITQEVTESLESIIKQRILDQAFDDVIRKLGDPDKGDYRKRSVELDMEKSTKSLSDIYEADYLKKTTGVSSMSTTEKKLSEAHSEAAQLFRRICIKLDALSNLHYAPIKRRDEIDIKKLNVPAITMEEIVPVAVSDAAVLAPEEIYNKKAKDVKGESEVSSADRKKDRRDRKEHHKKEKAEKEAKQKREAKLNPKKHKTPMSEAEAMKEIKRAKNITIVEDKDKGKKRFSTVQTFQKLQAQSAGAGMADMPQARTSNGQASQLKL